MTLLLLIGRVTCRFLLTWLKRVSICLSKHAHVCVLGLANCNICTVWICNLCSVWMKNKMLTQLSSCCFLQLLKAFEWIMWRVDLPKKKCNIWLVAWKCKFNVIYFSSKRQHYNLFHPFGLIILSWTEFVYVFVYFWKVLKPLGTFWNLWNLLEKGGEIWIWNWIWVKFELNWKVFEVFLKKNV